MSDTTRVELQKKKCVEGEKKYKKWNAVKTRRNFEFEEEVVWNVNETLLKNFLQKIFSEYKMPNNNNNFMQSHIQLISLLNSHLLFKQVDEIFFTRKFSRVVWNHKDDNFWWNWLSWKFSFLFVLSQQNDNKTRKDMRWDKTYLLIFKTFHLLSQTRFYDLKNFILWFSMLVSFV